MIHTKIISNLGVDYTLHAIFKDNNKHVQVIQCLLHAKIQNDT